MDVDANHSKRRESCQAKDQSHGGDEKEYLKAKFTHFFITSLFSQFNLDLSLKLYDVSKVSFDPMMATLFALCKM